MKKRSSGTILSLAAALPAGLLSIGLLSAGWCRAEEPAAPAVRSADGGAVVAHSAARADPPGARGETPLHPNAAAGLAQPYAGVPIDVTTFHYDAARTGWNQAEVALTPATVASSQFGLLKTLSVDGNVFAQPLLVSAFQFPDGSTHDVLIVATGHNSVYAYDAQSYDLLWQHNLGPSQSTTDVGCTDVVPEYGISSTPVIVRDSASQASIYLVAATEPSPQVFHTTLHRLDLATGADLKPPVEVSPQATLSDGSTLGFDAKNQWSRAALAWGSNSLYVGIGSHCDNNAGAISGWVLRYSPSLKAMAAFNTVDDPAAYKLSSVWGAGFGPAIDARGRLYAVTGNGDFDADQGGHDYGESVLSLAPNLATLNTSFTAGAYNALNDEDKDFGSGGVMLLPSLGSAVPPLAVAIGKDATLYLLNQNRLGGYTRRDSGALQALRIAKSGSGVWGGPAYYAGPNGPTVFVQTNGAVLHSYTVAATSKPSFVAGPSGTSTAGYGGSMPIVSSNGTTPGTGVVWVVRRMHNPQLEAYDAANLGAPIYQATAGTWLNQSNNAFLTAMQANGRVYVGTAGTVTVFGLAP